MTVTRRNAHLVPRVAADVARAGARRLHLARHVPCGQGAALEGELLEPAQWRAVQRAALRAARRHALEMPLRDPTWAADHGPSNAGAEVGGCAVGYHGLALAPDGTLYPCRRLPMALGNILHDGGRPAEAVESYREALGILDKLDGYLEMKTTVMTNLGGCLVAIGHFDQGMAMLRAARTKSQQEGFRRVAALVVTRMAEAWRDRGEGSRARELFAESDSLATRAEASFSSKYWKLERTFSGSASKRV